MRAPSLPESSNGFSLIELAVLLTAIAVISIGYLTWIQPASQSNAHKTILTYQRLSQIADALEVFRVKNGRLPCPADPTIRIDNTAGSGPTPPDPSGFGPGSHPWWGHGEEMLDIDTNSNECVQSFGAIPVKALNLNEDLMEDGWERRFTYHISALFCSTANICTSATYDTTSDGDLSLVNKLPDPDSTIATMVYVIVSHGPNGYGAYVRSGAQLTASGTVDETENSDGDIDYVKDSFVPGQFDDIVIAKTKPEIEALAFVPIEIESTFCDTVSAAVDTIDVTEATVMYNNVLFTQDDNGDGDATICITGSPPNEDCINTGDSAILGVLMSVLEACFQQHGTTRTCPGAGSVLGNRCHCGGGASGIDWDVCS